MRPALLTAVVMMACGAGAAEGGEGVLRAAGGARSSAPVQRYAYMVRPSEDLSEIDVTVCFDGPQGSSLHCPQTTAAVAVRSAEVRIGDTMGPALEARGRELIFPADLPPDACVHYVVNVDDAMGASWMNGTRVGDAIVINASGWLWAPKPLAEDATGTLSLELPEGLDAALSFPRDGERYTLAPSAFRYLSHTVFGRFSRFEVEVPGGRLDVARLPGDLSVSDDDLKRWLGATGEIAAQLDGAFPVERALIAVIPVGGGEDVAFGNVGRGGGWSVMFLTSRGATYDGLVGDWVPPHEFTHLSMPFVRRSDAWMSEGVATYYQEVLRARGHVQTPLEAWRNIDRGLSSGRGDGTGRSLATESARMFTSNAFRRVYWAGMAIAFMADVALRRRGQSLDEAIAALGGCCMAPRRTFGGRELAAAFDRATDTDVYSELADRWLPSHEFPDVEETFAWLGLRRDEEGLLELVDGAPGAAVRDAIMAPRDAVRSNDPRPSEANSGADQVGSLLPDRLQN